MKKLLLLLLLPIFCFSQQNAFLGIDFGMTKDEIKKEIKLDREKYKSVPIGGYLWRYYYQNNTYDYKGGVKLVRLTPKGSGLFGLSEHAAKNVFSDLINTLIEQGYESMGSNIRSSNYLEFKISETYSFQSKVKGKNIFIGTPLFDGSIFLNLVIMPYSERVKSKESVL
ncbi:MAG: hypothetical protein P8P72_03895 [Flavobacteriaceae bacterium]|nr:hypothetical protein [Flavobacteriaceae bacterium]